MYWKLSAEVRTSGVSNLNNNDMAYKAKLDGNDIAVYENGTKIDIADVKADDFTLSLLRIIQQLLTGEMVWYYSKLYPCAKFASTDENKVREIDRLTALLQKKEEVILSLRKKK